MKAIIYNFLYPDAKEECYKECDSQSCKLYHIGKFWEK